MGYNLHVLHTRHAEESIIDLRIPAMEPGRGIAKKLFEILNVSDLYTTASGKGRKVAFYRKDLPEEREVREALRSEQYPDKEDVIQFIKKARSLAPATETNPIYIHFN